MTTLYHKCDPECKCSEPYGQVVAKLPLMLSGITFGTSNGKDFYPIVTKLDSDSQDGSVIWKCDQCGQVLGSAELRESVFTTCSFCGEIEPLSNTVSSAYTPILGKNCLDTLVKNGKVSSGSRRYDTVTSLLNIKLSDPAR
jgi:hypothetical protein